MNQIVSPPPEALELIHFWSDAGEDRWFARDDAFDMEIRRHFAPLANSAAAGALDGWQSTREGSLALLLLLDQVPRNLNRGSAGAFATDAKARAAADAAIAAGFDIETEPRLRQFFYLPFMHGETPADQQRSVALYEVLWPVLGGKCLESAREHRDIIARFGRFPHRNAALGRETTSAERAYLEAGGFSG